MRYVAPPVCPGCGRAAPHHQPFCAVQRYRDEFEVWLDYHMDSRQPATVSVAPKDDSMTTSQSEGV